MPAESAPTPAPDGQGNPTGPESAIPEDPYRPQLPPKDRGPAGQEQRDSLADPDQPDQPRQGEGLETADTGPSDDEARLIGDMYGPYIESGDMNEEGARATAAEVIEVAGKLDDESLVAAHKEVSGILGSMQNWDEHLAVDPEAVGRNFDALVGAYKAGDAEAVADLRGMMGVADQGLWDRALKNLGDHIIPEQAEAEAEAATPDRDKLLPDDRTPEQLERARARERVLDLFAPEEDEKFLARLNEVGEAYSTTTRVMQALPYLDFDRAHDVYDLALDDPDTTPQALVGITAGLENLTLIEGEAALPLWRKALEGVADEAEQGGDKVFVVASALHDTLGSLNDEIERERQDPDADPEKLSADEALVVKLDNLAYEDAPPSLEQRQETMKRMKHLFDEVGLDGDGQWN